MKKFFYTLCFALVTAFAVSACADEEIRPQGNVDPCEFGGPGCPKK